MPPEFRIIRSSAIIVWKPHCYVEVFLKPKLYSSTLRNHLHYSHFVFQSHGLTGISSTWEMLQGYTIFTKLHLPSDELWCDEWKMALNSPSHCNYLVQPFIFISFLFALILAVFYFACLPTWLTVDVFCWLLCLQIIMVIISIYMVTMFFLLFIILIIFALYNCKTYLIPMILVLCHI